MNSIALKGQQNDFDLDAYLADQGLEVTGKQARIAAANLRNRGDVVYKVRNKDTGEEFDFDANAFLRDSGMEPDLETTFEREQKAAQKAKEAQQQSEDLKLRGELDKAGFGEYLARTAAPFTTRLMESGKISEDGFPSVGETARTGLAVGMDVASFLPRGIIGAYEGIKQKLTGKGKDMATSMAQVPSYGADTVKDPQTGKAREESLGEHFDAVKEAFRVDPSGVSKDILRESARDPLTGASLIAAASSGGTLAPALAGRVGPLLAQVASKYKTVGQAANVAVKAGKVLSKMQAKLEEANALSKVGAGIVSEGVAGGIQGVVGRYAMGEDQDAWNTFVVEGVEEGAFGALMAPLHLGWNYLSKEKQVEAMNQYREAIRALPPGGEILQLAGGRQTAPRYPGPGEPVDAEFTDVPRPQLPAGPGSGAPQITPIPGSPVTIVDGTAIPFDQELPAGVSRHEVIKKIENPAYKTQADLDTEKAAQNKRKAIKQDVKQLRTATVTMETEARKHITTAMAAALAETDTEDKAQVEAARKAHEATQKDVEILVDPTKETPFPVWNRLFGEYLPTLEEKTKAFEDFHVDEAKKIKRIKERISPPAESEGTAKPADKGYIEKAGGTNDGQGQVPNPGDGGGAQPGDGRPGGEAGPGTSPAGGDRADRPFEPGSGPERTNLPELPREPGKPRAVDAEPDDLLPPLKQAQKAEAEAAADRDYRPTRAPAWDNVDLRGKPPIELTRGRRVEMNQSAKDILDRVEKDPTSLTVDDREILRHYTGQGGLGAKADEDAAGGILNQHYTSYPAVKFAWDALEAAGFPLDKKRTALEPTAGIGNFIGLKPDNVEFFANEVDATSARVLKTLYPRNIVNREGPFESYAGPKVDIVATNVPFLSHRGAYEHLETDPKYKGIKSLHNYILMKSIDHLHDNGVGVFITSTGTMDAKTGAEFRKQFNQKAEILGAFRLPEGTFDKNTQYKGTTDLILVRKRTKGEIAHVAPEDRIQPEWVNTEDVDVKTDYGGAGTAHRSQWFTKHPEGVLGEFVYGHNRGMTQTGVKLGLAEGEDFPKALQRVFATALETLKDKYQPAPGAEIDPGLGGIGESMGRAAPETPVFGLEVKDGKVLRKGRDGELRVFRPDQNPKGKAWDVPESRFAMLVRLMEAADKLKKLMGQGAEVGFLQEHIKSLLEEWKSAPKYARQPMDKSQKGALFPGVTATRRTVGDHHVTTLKFGDSALEAFAGQDKRYTLLRGLYDKRFTGLSRILTEKPRLKEAPQVQKGDMSKGAEVVQYLLDKYGVFRDETAREAFRGTPEEYHTEMMAQPALNWDGQGFVHDDDFIQGDIREKIAYARKMGLSRQLKKLEAALPPQKTALTVEANPIATWWEPEALTAFMRGRGLGGGQMIARARVGYSERFRVLQGSEVVDRMEPQLAEFVDAVLNQRPVKVPDPSGARDSGGDPILVPDYALSQKIKEKWAKEFEAWAHGPGLPYAQRAATKFNMDFASTATTKEAEGTLFIAGLSPVLDGRPIKPYSSQMALVRRGVRLFGYIAAHGVGHGKTLGAIFTLAELRNRGMAKKTIFIVPAKNRGMWYSNLTQVMPGLEVKVVSSEGKQRRVDLIDAANNPYDAILISYDTFKSIPLAKGEQYLREDIARFKGYITELEKTKKGKDRLTDGMVKRIEEKVAKLENKLAAIQTEMKDPEGVVTYEDLGADSMFLDEAHTVKNSYEQMHEYSDRRFLNTGSDSQIGNDMVYKSRFLHEKNGRGGMFLLTATPTPNNPLEIYRIIKLVAPHEWTTRGINSVDDFVRNFVEIGPIQPPGIDAVKSSTTVAGKQREGVVGWKNLKALRAILNTWMDFRKDNDQVKKPEALARPTYVDMNDDQLNAMARILVLAEMPIKDQARLGVNMASLTMQAKLVSVDPAFLDPRILDEKPKFIDRSPKLKKTMELVAQHYKANPDRLQIVFLDFFRINDFKLLRDANGAPIHWPKGFGDLGVSEEGVRILPPWMDELDEGQRAKMTALTDGSRADYSSWPEEFMDAAGRPARVTENTVSRYRPEFDEEGSVFIKAEAVHENLHRSIADYAVNEIGIPRDRVRVVNANENGKPEDKTRIEQLVADGQLSLIVGNKPSIGEGMNLQNRGDAMYHLDVPWTPKELEQANGRMWRPRSEEDDFPITIYNMVAKGSLDAKGYAVLDAKEKWQQELFAGKADFMDNSLNNLAETGFSYKEMSDAAAVNPEYVAGYRLGAAVEMDATTLSAAKKERERIQKAMEVQKNAYAEAVRKVESAQESIRKGQAQAAEAAAKALADGKSAPAPYDPSYFQRIIENNTPAVEAGPKLIAEIQDKLKPFEQVDFDIQANTRARVMVKVARANKWKALGQKLEGERAEAYRALLQKVIPDINARYPLLADMMAAKAFGSTLPAEMGEAEGKLTDYLAGLEKDPQAGKASAKLLGGLAATGALATFFGPANTIALVGGSSAAIWAFRRLSHQGWFQGLTWSVHARLRQYPSFQAIEARFGQAHRLATVNIARTSLAAQKALAPLSEEERLLVAQKVENPSLVVPPAVTAAADTWRRVAAAVAREAVKVGYGLAEDPTYYPRVLDWEKVQAMKEDPELLDRNVQHLMNTQKLSEEDAAGLLLNFFDNTEEMRIDRATRRREEAFAALRRRNPNISDAAMHRAYSRMKFSFGEKINGNLRFQRRVPALLPEMYVRDPAQVLPQYLEKTWKSIAYRKHFGPNLDQIQDFLDTEFPIVGDKPSKAREEAQEFIDTELYRNRFPSMLPGGDEEGKEGLARKLTAYHVYTKLFTSVLSPARNVAFGLNMAIPLAGGRNTLKGIMAALTEGPTGYKNARMAGAIMDRVIRDAYETSKGTKGTAWDKISGAVEKWHPFMVTERFLRVFAFHAGQYRAESLFRSALAGDKRAIRDLKHELGAERFGNDLAAGQLSSASKDLYGLAMSEWVAGSTRPMNQPRWMNTPEGTVIGQFRRIAFDQTRVIKDRIIIPAMRGEFGPLLRWGTAVGLSSYVIGLLASMLKGDDDRKKKEPEGVGQQAWAFIEYVNSVNALGLWGDIANGLNSGDDWGNTPLVGTMVGPTLSSVLHAAKDLAWDAPHKDDSADELKQILKREIPFLSKLAKWDVPGFSWLKSDKAKGQHTELETWK